MVLVGLGKDPLGEFMEQLPLLSFQEHLVAVFPF